ncbi:MAG: [Fe-Fe] hydrogenase large subunit C-terminal domain-containing protein [Spirochaetia bacterium]
MKKPGAPVFTEPAECRDCYKCVRSCPVKAIQIKNNTATVLPELCVGCGKCVSVCPAGAKQVADHKQGATGKLASGKPVYLSIAPSFAMEFPDTKDLVQEAEKAGFAGIFETAEGAAMVSRFAAAYLGAHRQTPPAVISTACPVVVSLIEKYYPELVPNLMPSLSPLGTHGRMLKTRFGKDCEIVFAGPCIAKKSEIAGSEIGEALLFAELSKIFESQEKNIVKRKGVSGPFFNGLRGSETGLSRIYPIDGGMLESISQYGIKNTGFYHFSGMRMVTQVLEDLRDDPPKQQVFFELLACPGGCVAGCGTKPSVSRLETIRMNACAPDPELQLSPEICCAQIFHPDSVRPKHFSTAQIDEALRSLGKASAAEQLNCGGCGYGTCRDFAEALLADKAEPQMCVTNMRKMAQKKVNALIRSVPLSVVIVDNNFRVIECNQQFLSCFLGIDLEIDAEIETHLSQVSITKAETVSKLFTEILETEMPVIKRKVQSGARIYASTVFEIEGKRLFGGIFNDITAAQERKNTIVRKSQEVIQKSLQSVQTIASLLGENAAETEIILDSISELYEDQEDFDAIH